MTLTLSGRVELYALHRALMEAKFHESPDAPEVQARARTWPRSPTACSTR